MSEDLAEQAFIAYFGVVCLLLAGAVMLLMLARKRLLKIAGIAALLLVAYLSFSYVQILDALYRNGWLCFLL